MVQYTRSLPLDDVIAYLQDKDLSQEDLSQPENREMWVEIIQAHDDFSVGDLEKIVSDFYEIKKRGSTWERPWSTEYDFFSDGQASGWISELEIRGKSLFALTCFNKDFAEHLARQERVNGRISVFKEYYVCLGVLYSTNPEDSECTALVCVNASLGDEKTFVPINVPLPVFHVIECMSAINNWDVSDLIEKSVTLGLAEIEKNDVEIKSKPPEHIMKFSVDYGGFDNLFHLIKLIEENHFSIRDMGIGGTIIYFYLRMKKVKKRVIKFIGKKRYKAVRKKLRNNFRGSIDKKILGIRRKN